MERVRNKYTKEMLHYGEAKESVVRPGIKTSAILSVVLRGAWPDNWWHLKYAPGDRVWDPDAPARWMSKSKEHIWRMLRDWTTETEVIEEDRQCVLGSEICDFPKIIIRRADKEHYENIEFKDWNAAEKKYREIVKKFKLIEKPY